MHPRAGPCVSTVRACPLVNVVMAEEFMPNDSGEVCFVAKPLLICLGNGFSLEVDPAAGAVLKHRRTSAYSPDRCAP